jgi:hypothetical protein
MLQEGVRQPLTKGRDGLAFIALASARRSGWNQWSLRRAGYGYCKGAMDSIQCTFFAGPLSTLH